jgi:hypothetical protein
MSWDVRLHRWPDRQPTGPEAAVTGPARHLLPLADMGAIVVEQAQ